MTRHSSRTAVAAALVCLAATAVSSCTVAAAPDTGPAPAAAAPRAVTVAELRTLKRAEKLLTRDCMEKKGFSFWVTEELPKSVDRAFPYVIDDESWASENGYGKGIQDRRDTLTARNPNQRYFHSLSADRKSAAVAALNGPEPEGLEAQVPGMGRVRHSDEGCESEAQRSLYADLQKWYSARKVTEALEIRIRSAVVDDSRFAAAVTDWSTCMRTEGYTYASPFETRRKFLRAEGAGTPDAKEETRTATAEARCAVSSGLSAEVRALVRVHREKTNVQYATEVSDRAVLEYRALNRARDIVAND